MKREKIDNSKTLITIGKNQFIEVKNRLTKMVAIYKIYDHVPAGWSVDDQAITNPPGYIRIDDRRHFFEDGVGLHTGFIKCVAL